MSEVLFHSVHDLFAAGILRIAAQPPANPRDISGASFLTILLVAGDYPAKTPVMWNAAYREFGLPEVNVVAVADPADTAVILDVFRRDHRYRGGGAGVGFKGAIIPHLDEVTPLARAMGAVNIARNAPAGHLAGDNTDGDGFTRALEQRFLARDTSLQDKRIIILGAGDTAVPIGFALARRGAKPTFLNRTESKAEAAAEAVNRYLGYGAAIAGGRHLIPTFLPTADAVVSAVDDTEHLLDRYSTLAPMPLPATRETLRQNHARADVILLCAKRSLIVSDIRLRGRELPMLRQARELCFETLDGGPMVVNQGYEAFWWLYGEMLARRGIRKEDVATIMRQAANAA